MPLDPRLRRMLDQLEADAVPPICRQTPEQARRQMVEMTELLGEPEPIAECRDVVIAGPAGELMLRVYRSKNHTTGVLVYFHGGGWVIGSVDTHDGYCRALANASDVTIVAVEYRLAPEYKYPAAPEDCLVAVRWIVEHADEIGVDPGRVAVGGDSAGGNLALAVALMARDRGGPPIAMQALVYPVADFDFNRPSYHDFAEGYLLTRADMMWFWQHYLGDTAAGDEPYASPLRCDDLSGLPPALIQTAEYDVLRDEGEELARRLDAAGVPVNLTCYGGVIHGFARQLNMLPQARAALEQLAEALRGELVGD